MIKKLITLSTAAVLSLGLACPALSGGAGSEPKGTVSKIEGGRLTVRDNLGNEKAIEVKDQATLKNLKVGDRVVVTGDMVRKEGAEAPAPGSK